MRYSIIRMTIAFFIGIMRVTKFESFSTLFLSLSNYKSHVGWNTLVLVNDVDLNRCLIGQGNRFIGRAN